MTVFARDLKHVVMNHPVHLLYIHSRVLVKKKKQSGSGQIPSLLFTQAFTLKARTSDGTAKHYLNCIIKTKPDRETFLMVFQRFPHKINLMDSTCNILPSVYYLCVIIFLFLHREVAQRLKYKKEIQQSLPRQRQSEEKAQKCNSFQFLKCLHTFLFNIFNQKNK